MPRSTLIILIGFLSACANNSTESPSSITLCKDPRPQICTMIYAPVCGTNKDGERSTYASDCSACAIAEVTGFEQGKCP